MNLLWKHTTVNYFYLTYVKNYEVTSVSCDDLLSLTPMAQPRFQFYKMKEKSQSTDNTIVQQFGFGFDETVIASTSDG